MPKIKKILERTQTSQHVMKSKKKEKVSSDKKVVSSVVGKFYNAKLLKGMKDILPQDQMYWKWLTEVIEELAEYHGIDRMDPPVLEEANLFEKGTGKNTDIVEKEMYAFTDKSGGKIALRPEFTPSFARSYLEHGMFTLTQPVKLYSIGPLFRRENPQAGRLRQHHQWNVECIGSEDPVIDAQLILLSYSFYTDLGLDVEVHINSIGHPECRLEYKKQLIGFYRNKRSKLCVDCKRRLVKNPLRLLDCKEKDCQEIRNQAPQIVDWLCAPCKEHFMKLIEYLDSLEIPYHLNPFLVRGMDYYTRTVFEWYSVGEKENPSALGGGGRYDELLALYGGRPIPAAGFGLGLERVISELKEQGKIPSEKRKPLVYISQLGEQSRRKGLALFEAFRKEGILVAEHFAKSSLKAQLELANKLGVRYVLILGQKEVLEGTVLIRDMDGGIQESVPLSKVVSEIKKKLK